MIPAKKKLSKEQRALVWQMCTCQDCASRRKKLPRKYYWLRPGKKKKARVA